MRSPRPSALPPPFYDGFMKFFLSWSFFRGRCCVLYAGASIEIERLVVLASSKKGSIDQTFGACFVLFCFFYPFLFSRESSTLHMCCWVCCWFGCRCIPPFWVDRLAGGKDDRGPCIVGKVLHLPPPVAISRAMTAPDVHMYVHVKAVVSVGS